MISLKLRLNKGRQLNSGRYPLVIQLIYLRKKKLIYTPFKLCEENFDPGREKICSTSKYPLKKKEIKEMLRWIEREKEKLLHIIGQLSCRGEEFSVEDILTQYHVTTDNAYLEHYIHLRIAEKKQLGKMGTLGAYKSTLSSIQRFAKRKDIRLADITRRFIREYALHLLENHLSPNTVKFYIRNLRTIYNYALEEGYVTENEYPFKSVDTRPSRTVKRALTRDVMRELSSLSLPSHSNMELARDIFLFSFFSRGMAFVDVIKLKKSHIQQGAIVYQRQKTNQLLEVTLTKPLKELICKYENPTEYVFPIIRESTPERIYTQYRTALKLVNRHLKKIAALLNIDTCFTTYCARHTWATLARECGAPTHVISESLGHTSEKTTRIYLKQLEHTVIDKINEIVSQL